MYEPRIIAPPTIEPVTVTEIKVHSRIDNDEEDAELLRFEKAARDYVEWRMGSTIMQTTLEWDMDRFPRSGAIELPRGNPLISIGWIKYTDSAGNVSTWSSSSYVSDSIGQILPAYGLTWPSYTPRPLASVTIRYTAGIQDASPASFPDEGVKLPILLLVAGMYENRESEVYTDRASIQAFSMKYGVEAFLARQQRQYVF